MADTRWMRTAGLILRWTASGDLTVRLPHGPDTLRVDPAAVGLLDLFTEPSDVPSVIRTVVDSNSTSETRGSLTREVRELIESWQRWGLLTSVASESARPAKPRDDAAHRGVYRAEDISARRLVIARDFFEQADSLRAIFEKRSEDLELRDPELFAWHNRYLPGRSAYACTPFETYFPAPLADAFLERLVQWGLENLGCYAITPPMLVCYTDGCRLGLHADGTHGPWGFVYSLTRLERFMFHGGETVLMRPEALEYWRRFEFMKSTGPEALLEHVEPAFNQLVAFDARIPHGVNEVAGSRYPTDGRLVVTGWFVEPELYASAELRRREVFSGLETLASETRERLYVFDGLAGLLTLRLAFGTSGRVEAVSVLSNTLMVTHADPSEPGRLLDRTRELLLGATVSGASEHSWAILPLRLPRRPHAPQVQP